METHELTEHGLEVVADRLAGPQQLAEVLLNHNDGRTHEVASKEWDVLVKRCLEERGKGVLTLKLTIEPTNDDAGDVFDLKADITVRTPTKTSEDRYLRQRRRSLPLYSQPVLIEDDQIVDGSTGEGIARIDDRRRR